jgi:hypothetical protein
MRRTLVIVLVALCLGTFAAAVEGGQVLYVAGSINSVAPGTVGRLDTSDALAMRFVAGTGGIVIPYQRVTAYSEESEVAHHIGVLPAIAVGLVKVRHRRHYLHVTFSDENGSAQIVEFEIPKQMPKPIMDLLRARVPCPPVSACKK